ncbi:tetratricopeptide repeat protein [Tumebacillus sp. ITR2]|uniref:Tetratricopeptide repeat protein n=1 Tax=Tumebacillus amylolyticus TaxID=2801339 RepID=A0ABS1JCT9_9BACL|nr:tetratricopeptide repeat protein [Tumebacillus amylolyticus]MBL0388065.1 tetratricopeptide repeat protein [Tumebacillus amylolyticus]
MTASATSNETRDPIPLGRRIQEILEEKGAAYLVGFFANRIRFNPHRLVSILQSAVVPSPEDLEQIAKGLGITVERLTREDTQERLERLHELLQSQGASEETVLVAEELAALSLGATERADAYCLLGRAYYAAGKLEEAHEAFLKSYRLYEPVFELYQDSERMYRFTHNLSITYTVRKEYSGLADLLKRVESFSWDDPVKAGSTFFASAVAQYELGQLDDAKRLFQKSLTAYRETDNREYIGRGYYNLGRVQYLTGELQAADSSLESALHELAADSPFRIKAVEMLIKARIHLGELESAMRLIQEHEPELHKRPQVLAYLYLLHAYKSEDLKALGDVLAMEIVEREWKASGYKYLMKHYSEHGDSLAVMTYFQYYLQTDQDSSSFEDLFQRRD